MKETKLQEEFCAKIGSEIKEFEQRMIKKSPEEVYYRAYQIDGMNNIYECLVEISRKMEVSVLRELLVFPNLLAFLYRRWKKTQNGQMEKLKNYLENEISEMQYKCRVDSMNKEKGEREQYEKNSFYIRD